MRITQRFLDKLEFLNQRTFVSNSIIDSRAQKDAMRMKLAYKLQELSQKDFIKVSNVILQNGRQA